MPSSSTPPRRMWCLMQTTKYGERYYTGKGHPISPDAWTPAISRAGRFSWDQVVNMQAWVSAHTSGDCIQRIQS